MEETSYSIGYSLARWANKLGLDNEALQRLMAGAGTEADMSALCDLVAKEDPAVALSMRNGGNHEKHTD